MFVNVQSSCNQKVLDVLHTKKNQPRPGEGTSLIIISMLMNLMYSKWAFPLSQSLLHRFKRGAQLFFPAFSWSPLRQCPQALLFASTTVTLKDFLCYSHAKEHQSDPARAQQWTSHRVCGWPAVPWASYGLQEQSDEYGSESWLYSSSKGPATLSWPRCWRWPTGLEQQAGVHPRPGGLLCGPG